MKDFPFRVVSLIRHLVLPLFLAPIVVVLFSCEERAAPQETCVKSDFFGEFGNREFQMGFSSWPYAATAEAVDDTYRFISENADVYSEHIDANIPWNAW